MNKTLITQCAAFIGLNFVSNIFLFSVNDANIGYKLLPLYWLSCFLLTYLIYFFINQDRKTNWLAYFVYFLAIGFCLNTTTFKYFKLVNYNFDHVYNSINKPIQEFIQNQLENNITNISDFSINLNLFSLFIIVASIGYFIIFKNKYINQTICNSIFLSILIIFVITTLAPFSTSSNVFDHIGKGDLATWNDKIGDITHFFYYSSVSIQITLFTLLSLLLIKENWAIGICVFIILILLIFSHILLNYSQPCEIILSLIVAFSIYFMKTQRNLKKYSESISFFK